MMTIGRLRRKKTISKMTGKQKRKHRNVTLKFMSITGMMMNMNKTKRALKLKKKKMQTQKKTKEKIEKNK